MLTLPSNQLLRPAFFAIVCTFAFFCSVLPADTTLDFVRDVRPILSEACFHCHGPDAATREADLRLDLSESARTVTTSDDNEQPILLQRIHSDDPDERMPPQDSRRQLNDAQKQILSRWIETGGLFEEHWAFRPPRPQRVPNQPTDGWCANPIDGFVLAELKRNHLSPSQTTDANTLLRRLSLDLTGLPPTREVIKQFEQNAAEIGLQSAADLLIGQLMHSPSYGEHMALTWLEAARYADTDGYQNDRYRYQHAWRDWVIRAFNEKLPYDQFVIEQIAGDMLDDATLWQQVASGFGRNHRINSEDGSIPEEWRVENVVDRVDTFGTVFLGLTIGCARCHDHKYDPISQKEYYQLFAYFNSVAEHGVGPNNGNSPPFVELPASWPYLSKAEDCALIPDPVELHKSKNAGNGLLRPQAGSPTTVMVMHELAEPRESYLLIRGQYDMPDKSERLWPDVPAAFLGETGSGAKEPPRTRLELANWLVNGRNPLTARVAVNRIWQQFFGAGLVATSDNLGSQGELPSHPDLLDWLAVEFVGSGWDLQHVQRLILQSSTYRQSSTISKQLSDHDPTNRWLARGPRLRLSAFVLRDQALAAAGLLVQKTGGPSVKPYMPKNIWSAISNNKYEQESGENLYRRSMYTYWRRTIPPPTMMNFNAAAREVCSVRTNATNTPLQALTLMNNKTFIEAARALAERALREHPDDVKAQIDANYLRCTGRRPTTLEMKLLRNALGGFQAQFARNPSAAGKLTAIGQSITDPSLDKTEHAAMTMLASLILNLDETITKE